MSWTIHGRRYATRDEMAARVTEIDRQYGGKRFDAAARAEWNSLNEEIDEAEREIRIERLKEIASRPGSREPGCDHTVPGRTSTSPAGKSHDRALAVVDRFTRSGAMSHAAADRLDRHVRRNDPQGLDSRYLAAVGAPAYATAFAKVLSDPVNGHLRHEPNEVEAMRAVGRVVAERAAMEGGTGNLGGFALPVEVDPTVILSSDGAINPVRDLATVRTISTREWTGVSSDGVVASYDAELAEVSDDSPTFAQPSITTAMGRAFVQASAELFDDWSSVTTEMTRLFSDARDVLDAQAFLDGSGTDEPEGLLTGLTASEEIDTVGSGAFALADVYSLKQAVPDRHKGATVFAAHSDTMDVIYQMVGLADPSEALAMEGRAGPLLGKGKTEWNTMETGVVAGSQILLAGDFKAFVIADRIGSSVELVPHMLGANRLPTGSRGLFFRWRTGSTVVNPNAFRVLVVKA